jgi:hypothetical protein
MPVAYVATKKGDQIPFREWLKDHGLELEREIPHPPILYTGEFSDGTHAGGSWVILAHSVRLDDTRVLKLPGATGTWALETA